MSKANVLAIYHNYDLLSPGDIAVSLTKVLMIYFPRSHLKFLEIFFSLMWLAVTV